MFPPYTTVPERRAGYPPTHGRDIRLSDRTESDAPWSLLKNTWAEGLEQAHAIVVPLARYIRLALKRFAPILLFLAEATVAVQGHLFWPSIALPNEGTSESEEKRR